MILKRWQFIVGALAIWAGTVFCSLPTQSPMLAPTPTRTEAPEIHPSASPSPPQAPKTIREKVSALQSLNVRMSFSEKSASLGVLYRGDPVILVGDCIKGWARIIYKVRGKITVAWVNSRYITGDRCGEE